MEERFTLSVICPTLIGREGDLAALQWLVEETKRGQGRVAFVSGEAGVGKSRLMTETAHFARQQGFFHLQGHCFQSDNALAYAPFLDLLRSYMMSSTPEQIAQEWEPIAPELLQLLPEVRRLIPPFASVLSLPALDPQQEKRRLFGAITHFFTQLATRQPLLLVVEDLHWCDDIGLECVLHLARHAARLPLFLLLSYRNDEVSARLRHWLAAFDRGHLSHEVVLARLSRDDVDAMLQAIFALHASLHTGLLESIYALTDGNPFFIEEVLKSLIASGEIAARNGVWERTLLLGTHQHHPPIPRSVQDAVHQRSEHLTPLAQQLLTLAAVAGRRFDFSALRSILQVDEKEMLPLVKELMEAQFIVEESEDRFSFRHALTRQAIYSKLLIRERKALHRTLAETIEALHPSAFAQEALVVDLAYHFFEGAVWSKALEYGQRAAERSVALYAPRAAIEHFTRALQAQSHLQERPSAELHRARGQAYETLGEFERARRDYEQALHMARHTQDGIMEWQSLLDIGFLWAGRDYLQAARRGYDIHFPRYQVQHEADRKAFQGALHALLLHIPLQMDMQNLMDHWYYFYERSIGCVGVLKDWLVRAYHAALRSRLPALTLTHMQTHTLANARCESMIADANAAEQKLHYTESSREHLWSLLGMSGIPISGVQPADRQAEMSVVAPLPKRSGRVGERAPGRDPVGETQAEGVATKCSFAGIIKLSPRQMTEARVLRVECPECLTMRALTPQGATVRFPPHDKRKTRTPHREVRWMKRGTTWMLSDKNV